MRQPGQERHRLVVVEVVQLRVLEVADLRIGQDVELRHGQGPELGLDESRDLSLQECAELPDGERRHLRRGEGRDPELGDLQRGQGLHLDWEERADLRIRERGDLRCGPKRAYLGRSQRGHLGGSGEARGPRAVELTDLTGWVEGRDVLRPQLGQEGDDLARHVEGGHPSQPHHGVQERDGQLGCRQERELRVAERVEQGGELVCGQGA